MNHRWRRQRCLGVRGARAIQQARNDSGQSINYSTTSRIGQRAGIDPVSGRIWFGAAAKDIVAQIEVEGVATPLYFVRVGTDHYLRKGRLIGHISSLLAEGQHVAEDVYLVDFPFDDRTVRAEATFVGGSEILIGTQLLRQYRLEIHFPERTVLLERVS